MILFNSEIRGSEKEDKFLTISQATKEYGYSVQYLRRLLRHRKITGEKLGQNWLIRQGSLIKYTVNAQFANDGRFGPRRKESEETV